MQYGSMTALVTGASAGMGEAFARQLAERGTNLVLVARSKDKLEQLAGELRVQNKVQVTVLSADLSSTEAVDHLIVDVMSRAIQVDILVNNAGFGVFQDFLETPLNTQLGQIDLNIRALVSLTHAFTPRMVAARKGGVINIASTAAFQPLAGATVYAASKAFVLFFGEGLSLELEKAGVTVTTACPGPVATHFFADMSPSIPAKDMAQPGPVVRDILRGFERGHRVVYPGGPAVRLGTLGARLLPRNVILRLARGVTRSLNQEHGKGEEK